MLLNIGWVNYNSRRAAVLLKTLTVLPVYFCPFLKFSFYNNKEHFSLFHILNIRDTRIRIQQNKIRNT